MASTTLKVRTAAGTARPYLERAITDEEFRENLRAAFAAAKQIYDELVAPKGVSAVATRVATDEEIQKHLRKALGEMQHAAHLMAEEKRESHALRNGLLVLVGIVIGIFFNPFTGPETRRWVKTRVSGGEFSYDGRTSETVTA